MESRAAELRALLESAGLRPKGSVHVWQFDPPFQARSEAGTCAAAASCCRCPPLQLACDVCPLLYCSALPCPQWRWFRTNEVLFEVEGGAEAVGAAASS